MSVERTFVYFWFYGAFFLAVLNPTFTCSIPLSEGVSGEEEQAAHEAGQKDTKTELNDSLKQNIETELLDSAKPDETDTGTVLQTRGWGWLGGWNESSSKAKIHPATEVNEASAKGQYIHFNSDGVRATVVSPGVKQSIEVQGSKVLVNGKIVCENIRKIKREPSHQLREDGSQWFTNLQVGEPMTDEEILEFKEEADPDHESEEYEVWASNKPSKKVMKTPALSANDPKIQALQTGDPKIQALQTGDPKIQALQTANGFLSNWRLF